MPGPMLIASRSKKKKPDKEKGHYTHPELFGHVGEPSVMEMQRPHPPAAQH